MAIVGTVIAVVSPPFVVAEPIKFDCVIEAQQVVKLASSVVGVIARLDVDRGDVVRRGEVIGKLEDSVEQAALALAQARATNDAPVLAAEARLRVAKSEHARVAALQGKNVVSRAELESAEEAANVAAQQLEEAKLNEEVARLQVGYAEAVLAQRTLRSPVDGVVVERLLVPGEYRNEQGAILTLAQIDPLRVEAFLPTAYYGQIQKGSEAEIRPEQPVGGTFRATVVVVDQVIDAASGTFGVRLALPNPALSLPAGIRCKVVFNGIAEVATSGFGYDEEP